MTSYSLQRDFLSRFSMWDLLPLTVSSAVDWLSSVLQVYFPASLSSTLLMISLVRRPSCFISYLYPGLRITLPFLQSTGAPGLESSQLNTPLSPSFTSKFATSFLNVTGIAKNQQIKQNFILEMVLHNSKRILMFTLQEKKMFCLTVVK